jgi:hypothetical protein
MAKAMVARQNIAWGRVKDTEKPCLSMETSYIRQRLSSAIVTCFWAQKSVKDGPGGKWGCLGYRQETAVGQVGRTGQRHEECSLACNSVRAGHCEEGKILDLLILFLHLTS